MEKRADFARVTISFLPRVSISCCAQNQANTTKSQKNWSIKENAVCVYVAHIEIREKFEQNQNRFLHTATKAEQHTTPKKLFHYIARVTDFIFSNKIYANMKHHFYFI